MSTPRSSDALSESLLEEAAGWFIDFNEGELDARGREQFIRWLSRSPEHVRAYLETAATWEDAAGLRRPGTLQAEALVAQALADQQKVIRLAGRQVSAETPAPALSHTGYPALRPKHVAGFVALAASFAVAFSAFWILSQRNTFVTAMGEQRSITLADGSTVELNAHSRLKVRFTSTERRVELYKGQALFRVKKDPARPFIVRSDGTQVRAVGTQFEVFRKSSGTVITVLEGRVAVVPTIDGKRRVADTPAAEHPGTNVPPSVQESAAIFLVAGEQLTVAPELVPQPVQVDVTVAAAWTQRQLMFNETPLVEVVAEFNRYNARKIILEDADLGAYHIRGNFQATEPDRLVEFLRDRFGVRVSEQQDEVRIGLPQ